MSMLVRGSGRATAAASAAVLLGLVSCADLAGEDDPAPVGQPPPTVGVPPGPVGVPPPAGKAKQPVYKSDELLVRWKAGITRSRASAVHGALAAQVVHEYRVPSNLQLIKLPGQLGVDKALEQYRRNPDVLYAEPNYIYQLDVTPDDPLFDSLWGMHNIGQTGGFPDADIDAPEAWQVTTGSDSVVIGVIDTGVDYNHEDLAANMFVNPGEIAGNGIDDDGNGWIDDVHGINTVLEIGDPMDDQGHGTHVSGTIAAQGDNGVGVAGVSWDATIVACEAFAPFGQLDDLLQCLDYFLDLKTRPDNPIDIVATSNSWGGAPFSQALFDAIGVHRQAGMLFVAAAGNASSDTDVFPHFPSGYEHDSIISVLATDHFDQRAFFSNFGALSVDIGAPGDSVLSTFPGNAYLTASGTSMATPHVTGLVALLKAQDPTRTPQQIKNLILTGGDPLPFGAGLSLTGRRINAHNSLTCVDRAIESRVAPTASSLIVSVGETVALGMLSITCDAPSSGPLAVTVIETGATIPLIDAGGSGQFSGSFTPITLGTSTLAFPNGDLVSVTTVINYDAPRVVPFELVPITGTVLPLPCDDCSASIESPFPIRFGGATPGLTTVHVSSNGALSFSGPIFEFFNQPLPVPFFDTMVAPLWDDLFPPFGGTIRFEVVGAAPSRRLVVEYRDIPHISFGGAVTFQVVFFENNPNIQFNYADIQFGASFIDNGASATVGIQLSSSIARQFSFNTPSLSDNLSLLWTMGAPLAVAGADQVVAPLAAVELDGSASQDFDGTIATFAWTQVAGAPVVLAGAATATPSFTAPGTSGTLTFRLEVTDNEGNAASDTVDVIVNQAPTAIPNDDFRVATNLVGRLDATASVDPDGTVVGFQWRQVHGDPVALLGAGTPIATFVAPATPQFLVFELTVADEHGFTGSALVVADVFFNLAPVAEAGQNRIVRPGSSVTLDGSASRDDDGELASFAWTVVSCFTTDGPCSLSLTGAGTATPQFVAPGAPGVAMLRLTVTDDAGASSSDLIVVGMFVQPPVAAITATTVCAQGGATQTLDGSHSVDPDGTVAAFAWTQLAGPPVALTGAASAVASFVAPSAGTLVFALAVTDSDGLTDTAEVTIPIDPPPVARATASAPAAVAGTTVTLDGTQSSDAASVFWRQIAGTTAILSNASSATPTFVAPNPPTAFELATFELTVTDACGARSTATVTVVIIRT